MAPRLKSNTFMWVLSSSHIYFTISIKNSKTEKIILKQQLSSTDIDFGFDSENKS